MDATEGQLESYRVCANRNNTLTFTDPLAERTDRPPTNAEKNEKMQSPAMTSMTQYMPTHVASPQSKYPTELYGSYAAHTLVTFGRRMSVYLSLSPFAAFADTDTDNDTDGTAYPIVKSQK